MAYFGKVISVVFQYGMLLWLIYFVTRLARYFWDDIKNSAEGIASSVNAPNKTASLRVLSAEDASLVGRTFPVNKKLSLGREADNDIVIADNFVSHHHAIIIPRNNLFVIEDLGSANFTYLNGQVLKGRAYLRPGDEIRIGLLALRFER